MGGGHDVVFHLEREEGGEMR
jgi:hypothetical protein